MVYTDSILKSNSQAFPLYDIYQSFEANLKNSFVYPQVPLPSVIPTQRKRIFDYWVNTPIGVAPCAVTTSRGIGPLAALGFDVLTYKTIRSRAQVSHAWPNIFYLEQSEQLLSSSNITQSLRGQLHTQPKPQYISITNSIGIASLDPESTAHDIEYAKTQLKSGQILIVSVYGSIQSKRTLIEDFLYTAQLAESAGADIIELNLSCPNLVQPYDYLYQDLETSCAIISRVSKFIKKPIIVKIGLLEEKFIEKFLQACARAGAHGISAINAMSMRVLNSENQPVFGQRILSGVSGYMVRSIALDFIKRLAYINYKNRLNLILFGMGGITQPEHFVEFHQAGADVALSATAIMWNPYLAIQYREHLLSRNIH